MPFVICAKRIIEISFKPVVDIITPKKMINIQVNLKCNDFKFDGSPKQPHTTKAAARGAVIVLVIPAAKRPIAIKYFAKLPNIGSKPIARSPALLISNESIFEAVIIIHRETNPPILMAIIKSL